MRYKSGDLVLIAFPLSSGEAAKQRRALVILDTGDQDVLVARITTHVRAASFDVALDKLERSGPSGAIHRPAAQAGNVGKGLGPALTWPPEWRGLSRNPIPPRNCVLGAEVN